ncbi:mitochondrial inner membrane protein OXA1L [Periplaneta americana]|uniref:mitochondrial inner membrane protein OXA1L n=1 Tax=Periplaneta americana TaxID=6978 RepID=UPI0037E971E2
MHRISNMATVVFCNRSAARLKLKTITSILGYIKGDGVASNKFVRYHHFVSGIRNCNSRDSQRKSFAVCGGSDFLGITVSRLASTSVQSPPDSVSRIPESVSNPDSSVQSVPSDKAPTNAPEVPPAPPEAPPAPPEVTLQTVAPLDNIPEPPPIPVEVELVQELTLSGEQTFASIGLGGWSPVGIVQNCLEYLHITCDLPWWMSIVIGTAVVRVLIFPLVIMAQRNAAKMTNNMPQLQTLQLKMTEARQTGNQLEAARYAQEMVMFMKEKELNPMKNVLVPLAQAPLFISFFMGLRGMANVPVESMRSGGLFWFTDLTVPDQYYLMPLITSLTMWITIEVGTDGARLSSANLQTMKYVLRAMPVCILPFTINFPGAILVYWVSTNFISLMQVGFLRIPAVREFFKIEKAVVHSPDSLPMKPKGFVKGLKDSWTNMKITKELEERQRFDELQFQRAGKGPIQKTYKYDPTRPRRTSDAIAAKERER